jgi:formate/nitrite transporter
MSEEHHSPPTFDALMPPEIAAKATDVGAAKAGMPTLTIFALAVLAGAFIALGALFSTTVVAGAADVIPYGVVRLLAGLVFCLGLILVVVAGAELFTGNNLISIAWAERKVSTGRLLRNWTIVYLGNLVGALATVGLVFLSGQYEFGDGAIGSAALAVADTKSSLGFGHALVLGIMCNALVCLAIWMTYGARSVTDKILAILFPITAFVAIGFEHSIANWFFLPFGLALDPQHTISPAGVAANLVVVTAGNLVGGTLLVAGVYWVAYLRNVPK